MSQNNKNKPFEIKGTPLQKKCIIAQAIILIGMITFAIVAKVMNFADYLTSIVMIICVLAEIILLNLPNIRSDK